MNNIMKAWKSAYRKPNRVKKTINACSVCGGIPIYYRMFHGFNIQCESCGQLYIVCGGRNAKTRVIGAWNKGDKNYLQTKGVKS